MPTPHITDTDFDSKVLKSEKLVFVDFYADWCGPCKIMAPVIDELHEDLGKDVDFYKIDVDKFGEIAGNYGIMSIPTFICYKNGQPVKTFVGVNQKNFLASELKKLL